MIVLAEVDREIAALLRATPALVAYCTGGVHNMVAPSAVTGPHAVWTAWPGEGDQRAIDRAGPEMRVMSVPRCDAKILVPGQSYTGALAALTAVDAALEAAGWMREREIHYVETAAGGAPWWHVGGEYRKVVAT